MQKGTRIRLILWKAHKAVEAVDRASITATGLCLTDFAVLEILLHKGPMPVNVIGQKVLLTSGSITSAVNRLERRGWVRRHRDASDRRVFLVELTEGGRSLIRRAFNDHDRNLEAAVTALDSTERDELIRLLKKLGRSARDFTPDAA
jgi:MarR family 2-MHQ and catechol resistance regulon transcriptional repressor